MVASKRLVMTFPSGLHLHFQVTPKLLTLVDKVKIDRQKDTKNQKKYTSVVPVQRNNTANRILKVGNIDSAYIGQ